MRQLNYILFIWMGTILFSALFSATLLAQDASNAEIKLQEAAICRNIENRVPIGRGSVFHTSIGRLYCFTKVVGVKTETSITHHWYLNGMLKASVTLPVKSASWRTWSSKDILPNESGDWLVEILTADGDPLESILFLVQ